MKQNFANKHLLTSKELYEYFQATNPITLRHLSKVPGPCFWIVSGSVPLCFQLWRRHCRFEKNADLEKYYPLLKRNPSDSNRIPNNACFGEW